jgi:hypothetical protein
MCLAASRPRPEFAPVMRTVRPSRGVVGSAVQELLDTRHVERLVLGNSSREIAELLAVFGYHDYSKLGRMQVLTYI